MLKDKRSELDGEKRKKRLGDLLNELSRSRPDLYYQSTSQIAHLIKEHIETADSVTTDDRALLAPLSVRDIEIILGLN